jgi:hypothetical protein
MSTAVAVVGFANINLKAHFAGPLETSVAFTIIGARAGGDARRTDSSAATSVLRNTIVDGHALISRITVVSFVANAFACIRASRLACRVGRAITIEVADIFGFDLTRIDFKAFFAIARVTTPALAGADARFRVCAISMFITSTVGAQQISAKVDRSACNAGEPITSVALSNEFGILAGSTVADKAGVAFAPTLARGSHGAVGKFTAATIEGRFALVDALAIYGCIGERLEARLAFARVLARAKERALGLGMAATV